MAKNLPILEYVLYPKLSGLLCILNLLKERRENLIQLTSSDAHNSAEGSSTGNNGNNLNTNLVENKQVDRNNILEKNKEHKSDCVRNIPEVTSPSLPFNESKDGYKKDEKEVEKVIDIDNQIKSKIDVKDDSHSQQVSASKSHRATTALHDLTIAYTDYLPGKKTTHRSILYGKLGSIKCHLYIL